MDTYESVNVVIGNESCDLDSAISALVYAAFLNVVGRYRGPCLAVMNVDRGDFPLRTEVAYFLDKFGVSSEQLVFRYVRVSGLHQIVVRFIFLFLLQK